MAHRTIFKSLMSKGMLALTSIAGFYVNSAQAEVTLVSQTLIADNALHFDGQKTAGSGLTTSQLQNDEKYHYYFGGSISAHGDSVKVYKNYVFMTWYRGGKHDRHMMLSRLNTETGVVKTIEFPHRHTGYQGNWWVGESHNTIGIAVSPKNGTIHMVFDMHAYSQTSDGGKFADDYFRYSYSVVGAAEVPDDQFTLDLFVKDTSAISQGADDYKHLVMTRNLADKDDFSALTYPKFYETKEGDLLHYMRWGGNNNGAYYYNRYDADADKWSSFVPFNHKDQKSKGDSYNWGLYGEMKYVNGKLRVGFQKRSSNNSDKFQYQNGIFYAYLEDADTNDWRDHTGKKITWPLVNADEIKIFEPGDLVETTSNAANGPGTPPGKVHIVGNFDWTVTEKGDIHFIHLVKDNEFKKSVYSHLYKPAGANDFINAPGIPGASEINAIGDDVYIIGLENKKPYVEVAKGGTTEFTRIYTDTTTATNFQHGVPYVKDGKVYYYLMEEALGNARPLHLQVIDLGVAVDPNAPIVSFNKTLEPQLEGYGQISLGVNAASPEGSGRTITKVDLYINDTLIRSDNSLPYLWGHNSKPDELTGLLAGMHTIKAIATDSEGATSAVIMPFEVLSTKPTASFPSDTKTLLEGFAQLTFEVKAEAYTGRTIESVTLYLNDQLVRVDDSYQYLFGHSSKPHETGAMGWLATHQPNPNPLTAGIHTFKAVVLDSAGETGEATMTVVVESPAQPPVVTWPNETVEVFEGYQKLSITVQAESPEEGRTVQTVTLYRNGELVRTDTAAPWNWGHSGKPYEFGAMGWLETHAPNPEPLGVGEHTFTVVAVDSEGLESSADMTLIVKSLPAPTISTVEPVLELTEGYEELYLTFEVSTANESVTVASVDLYLDGSAISTLYEAPFTFAGAEAELLGLTAGTYEFTAVATDSNNRMGETTVTVNVTAAAAPALLGDLDSDGDVDRNDVRAFSMAVRTNSITDLAYDFNKDGLINSYDVRGVALLCTRSGCATE
ncbi:Ig-like domain-containing protein [Catenovulum agarivorans]|uniref:Ig-like domain-containing protein n=1 Tax=Catenovulum agarivorans TaxID=1172192 RepID=UPI00030EE06D|nr:BNR-4 repeat-containing protein [Catenovulum agarivorans]